MTERAEAPFPPLRRRLGAAAVFLVSLLYLFQFHGTLDARGIADEGHMTSDIQRMSNGELIYQDFFLPHAPLSLFLVKDCVYPLLGTTLDAVRFVTAVLGACIAAMIFLAAVSLGISIVPALLSPLVFVFFGFHNWNNASPHWFSIAAAMFSVLVLRGWIAQPRRKFLLSASGFISGTAVFLLQSDGTCVVLGSGIYLLLRPGTPLRDRLSSLARWSAGGAASIAAFLVYFYVSSRGLPSYAGILPLLRAFGFASVVWPMGSYAAFNALPEYFYFGKDIIRGLFHGLVSPHSIKEFIVCAGGLPIAVLFGYAPFPALALSAHRVWSRRRILSAADHCVFLLSLVCAFFFVTAVLVRPDPIRLIFFSPFTFLLLAFFIPDRGASARPVARIVRPAVWAILALMGAASAVWAISWTIALNTEYTHSVHTQRGTIRFPRSEQADEYSRLIREVNERTLPGSYLYIHGWSPQYYFLLNRRNPTSYELLIPVLSTPDQLARAVRQLDDRQPRYILYDGKIEALTADPSGGTFPMLKKEDLQDNPMIPYIHSRYRTMRTYPSLGLSLLERNGP